MFSEILVAYDGSDSAQESLEEAITLAATFKSNVHLAAVVHLSAAEVMAEATYPMGLVPYEKDAMEASLASLASKFAAKGCKVQSHIVVDNNPAATIRDLAVDLGVDLVILGHRRQGPLSRLWNGSVGLSLLANAPCSIFVATDPQWKPARPVTSQAESVRQTPRTHELRS